MQITLLRISYKENNLQHHRHRRTFGLLIGRLSLASFDPDGSGRAGGYRGLPFVPRDDAVIVDQPNFRPAVGEFRRLRQRQS